MILNMLNCQFCCQKKGDTKEQVQTKTSSEDSYVGWNQPLPAFLSEGECTIVQILDRTLIPEVFPECYAR